MDVVETINQWLAQISTSDAKLKLDDGGCCCLECENGAQCIIEVIPESDRGYFYSPLVKLPETKEQQADLLQEVLHLNLFQLDNTVSSMVLDKRTGYVMLARAISIEKMDFGLFQQDLADFIEESIDLQTELTSVDFSFSSFEQPYTDEPVALRV
ncbi:CesT family type III secretion system chaperone [Endozoicomonas sp. SM1973]|uniref:CesT family type III secretion system chaperone n=1 Tax=Spartinivicinus marinus TaxID=2994442 RepID=A0A853I8Y3_9GAMM|nr:CesT family type III secretion system chaperone [Spartinivicinus marinus]MCX4024634.1 CesT family type III secretion system chaperone [Spartinivicinus marinus]NYZ66341.1 CesT family type III secretion system chaperone [Spartinivicinus marinus]